MSTIGDRSQLLGEVVVLDDVGPPRRGRAYPSAGTTAVLLLPAAALLGVLVLWPVVRTVHASLTDGDGRFAGMANYRAALGTEGAWPAVLRTAVWALVVPGLVTVLGFLLAAAARRTPGHRAVTLALVAPFVLPMVVTAVAFRLLYDPDPQRGTAIRLLHVDLLWLGPRMITISLVTAFVWAWVGLALVVFRSALDAIPPQLADAVRVHGGTRRDVFRDALWRPLLRRTAALVFALVALATTRSFDLILVMAPGSVLDESEVLAVRVWLTSGATTSGPAAALGVVWLAIVALCVLIATVGTRQAWPPPAPAPSVVEQGTGLTADDVPARRGWRALPLAAVRLLRIVVPPVAALVWAVPLLVLVGTSLHTAQDAATRPWWAAPFDLGMYLDLSAANQLRRSLVVTGVLAAVVTVLVLLIATLAGYALASVMPPAGWLAGGVLLAAAVVPVQAIAGPVNEVLERIHAAGTVYGLALVHVALGVPFAVLMLRNALSDVPPQRLRAARLGGRGEWAALWRLLPAAGPALAGVAVLEFVQVWNDLVVGLLFAGPDATPLGFLLYGQSRQFVANSGQIAATSMVMSLVPLAVLALARRHLVAALVSTGIRR